MNRIKTLLKLLLPWLPKTIRFVFRNRIFAAINVLNVFRELDVLDVKERESVHFKFIYSKSTPRKLASSLKKQKYSNWSLVSANSSVETTENTWVCFVERDFRIVKGALRILSNSISKSENVSAIYCDHLEVSFEKLIQGKFKPAWSPDYFKALDYVSPALWVKVSTFNNKEFQIGGLLSLPPNAVKHLPIPLVISRNAKQNIQPVVYSSKESISTRFSQKVSIIIPTHNALHLLKPCVDSVLESTKALDAEIIIVDNLSDCRETLAYLNELSKRKLVKLIKYQQAFNYSAINNLAVEQAEGEFICLLNNDTESLEPTWLKRMLECATLPEVGCVGAKLYYPDGLVQHAGVVLGYGGGADHAFKSASSQDTGYMNRLVTPQNYSAVTAACLMVRKSIYVEVGGLDESLKVAFNDIDFCLRVRLSGYRNVWLPSAELLHFESPSRGQDDTPEKASRFQSELKILRDRWGEVIKNDPSYSPWLSLKRHDFAFSRSKLKLADLKLR